MTPLELILICQRVEQREKRAGEKLARAVREYLRAIGGFHMVHLQLSESTVAALGQLTRTAAGCDDVPAVLRHLASSAAQGVQRPGSWERGWIEQAFGGVKELSELESFDDEKCSGCGHPRVDHQKSTGVCRVKGRTDQGPCWCACGGFRNGARVPE